MKHWKCLKDILKKSPKNLLEKRLKNFLENILKSFLKNLKNECTMMENYDIIYLMS